MINIKPKHVIKSGAVESHYYMFYEDDCIDISDENPLTPLPKINFH